MVTQIKKIKNNIVSWGGGGNVSNGKPNPKFIVQAVHTL